MLKTSSFSPTQPRRAETRLFPYFVLGSSKSLTYSSGEELPGSSGWASENCYASGFDSPAALLDSRFEHPALWKLSMFLLVAVLSQSWLPVFAQTAETKKTLLPPQDLRVFDTPSDGGGSLTVLWSPASYDSATSKYQVLLSEGAAVADPAAMKVVAEFPANQRYVRESKWPWWTKPTTGDQHQFTLKNGNGVELKNGNVYSVTVAAVLNGDRVVALPAG